MYFPSVSSKHLRYIVRFLDLLNKPGHCALPSLSFLRGLTFPHCPHVLSFVREVHLSHMPIQGKPFASCVYTCTRDSERTNNGLLIVVELNETGTSGAGKRGVSLAEAPILLLCGSSTVSPIVSISFPYP